MSFYAEIHKPDAVADDDLRRQFGALKKAGKARYLGLVCHSSVPAVVKAAVGVGWYDVILSTYNFASRDDLKPMVPAAKAKDIGLLTMKSSRALPRGADFVGACKRFLADGIDAVLRTIQTAKELEDYLRLATKGDKTPALQAAEVPIGGQCTLCGACAPCPQGVAIQDVLRTFQYYAQDLGDVEEAFRQYAGIPLDSLPPACSDCGRCEAACPQDLPVRQLLCTAHRELELELVRHRASGPGTRRGS